MRMRKDSVFRRWSGARRINGELRCAAPIHMRLLPSEEGELKRAVLEASNRVGELLQPSDVVRACLIYCGVLSDVPASDADGTDAATTEEVDHADET